MNVLIIGSGGREHALAWKIAQSPLVHKLYIAPGNPGTASLGENVTIAANEIEKLLSFAKDREIDLTVVGPESPLDIGIVDLFQAAGLAIFGPTKAAAQIESSKAFSKTLMKAAGIPTAEFRVFTDRVAALAYVHAHGAPIVIKDTGLALGKGVYICTTIFDAIAALDELFSHGSGQVVVEDFLDGPEVSIHAICAGTEFALFPASQDHKYIGEGNTGTMTGGIGAISPLSFVTPALLKDVGDRIIHPILETLSRNGTPFSGLLYPGLILTQAGPKVLEYNARFGDPECGLYARLLKSDLVPFLYSSAVGTRNNSALEWNDLACVNLIVCSDGYPGEYKKGLPITGIEYAEEVPGVIIFHAGTRLQDGQLVTDGGRVLGVSAVGDTLQDALGRAYKAADRIAFEGKYYRHDIGSKTLLQK